LCLAIIKPTRVRNHLSEGMWITALYHAELAKELATLWVAVFSTADFTLGRSPNETFRVTVVGELVAKF
jgi:hypothetical protein